MALKIAVVGATSLIGHEIIEILGEGAHAVDTLTALTHKSGAGREMSFGDKDIKTQDVANFDFSSVDAVFYAGGLADAKDIATKAIKADAKIIDCSGALTFETNTDGVILMPGAATLMLLNVLSPLQSHTKIKRAVVTTFESTSAEGKDGMDELFNQSRQFFVTDTLDHQVFKKQIAFNVIPQTDDFMNDGVTKSEWALAAEMKKFFDEKIKISATCVQVPVFMGHGMAVNIEMDQELSAKEAKSLWRDSDGIMVIDRESDMGCVSPVEIAGEDAVFISRVRDDATLDNGLSFWIAADNIRCVAAHAVKTLFAS
jgi:aspartate-semialdehyde dehydrogenase